MVAHEAVILFCLALPVAQVYASSTFPVASICPWIHPKYTSAFIDESTANVHTACSWHAVHQIKTQSTDTALQILLSNSCHSSQ
ncbi:hypothetical protein JB92DRAFT_2853539 [Gautieria morchelliformis]|nr:hypothetical protein JB92DRAFT_2853539 [Gautieria morchelliformis]